MRRRPLPLLVLLMLSALLVMGALAGCDLLLGRQAAVIEHESITVQPEPATKIQPMDPLPSPTTLPTDEPPPPTEAPAEVPAETPSTEVLPPGLPEGPQGPELLEPPDEAGGSLMDLLWEWEEPLSDEQWFELYIWPDDPDAEPEVYGWYKEPPVRVTAANLLPGRYRWKVLVVEGQEEDRGEEVTPPSEEWRFTIVRPSMLSVMTEPSPVMPTRTPTPTRMPTSTPRPWWPSPTPDGMVTATPTRVTMTPAPPTATPTVDGYPGATETPVQPEPTSTPDGYPAPTNTPDGPAPTNTPAPTVTDTPVPPQATPEPTAYPG